MHRNLTSALEEVPPRRSSTGGGIGNAPSVSPDPSRARPGGAGDAGGRHRPPCLSPRGTSAAGGSGAVRLHEHAGCGAALVHAAAPGDAVREPGELYRGVPEPGVSDDGADQREGAARTRVLL